ncbi:MAG: hypothetical protein A2821_00935 [Candidatus Magasanikbacteria bacterium RIFCSPHIGHO2_01_FULL_41_23]|uniref:DUF1189 domain-containing protein n=1 Tax=Candidatus Magasanikbacteria bacterium RIFCSPLOWO2_01_FULL_40_15 TaxID=1798686 RepID=A0A1F6N1D1_9BACT|nr:MAG: hypothetical protein A2821_00935 [Candidatus Magasanikbacteria bacterium RIFCSPHIGHO2_01_FULL_41_23]OGH74739.1 MAG: hypothetical protein A3F22_02290 [Candidatus Magasanikbacteria bacterium RIFCSPHIGHO2_12_FULL_41_16]OGH77453.1 MAG: hypothetical protein A2983_01990 [Candidatus Magasanikbacteria bacterium RIFCSPLOWO2_01_FULL_40_15]
MWILTAFYNSLFNVAWLREQRGRLGRAFAYAVIFLVLIFALRLIQLAFFALPKVLETAETEIVKNTPDFTATWKNEKLAITGFPQPFVADKLFGDDSVRIVIDTESTSTPSIESLKKDADHDAIILITRDYFSFYNSEDKTTQTETFAGLPDDTVFTKANVVDGIAKVRSYGHWIGVVLLAIGVFVLLIGKFIGLLFLTGVVYIVARVRKFAWTYKEILATGFYATTLPTIIATTAVWFGLPFGFISTLVFLLLMYLVVSGFDNDKKTETPSTTIQSPN